MLALLETEKILNSDPSLASCPNLTGSRRLPPPTEAVGKGDQARAQAEEAQVTLQNKFDGQNKLAVDDIKKFEQDRVKQVKVRFVTPFSAPPDTCPSWCLGATHC